MNPKIEFLKTLLSELGNEERSRREPEHLYTSALIAASGAIVWGVAAIPPQKNLQSIWWMHPASIAGIGCGLLALAVVAKIIREHLGYRTVRKAQIDIAGKLADECQISRDILPDRFKCRGYACGFLFSLFIVFVAGATACWFCYVIYHLKLDPK